MSVNLEDKLKHEQKVSDEARKLGNTIASIIEELIDPFLPENGALVVTNFPENKTIITRFQNVHIKCDVPDAAVIIVEGACLRIDDNVNIGENVTIQVTERKPLILNLGKPITGDRTTTGEITKEHQLVIVQNVYNVEKSFGNTYKFLNNPIVEQPGDTLPFSDYFSVSRDYQDPNPKAGKVQSTHKDSAHIEPFKIEFGQCGETGAVYLLGKFPRSLFKRFCYKSCNRHSHLGWGPKNTEQKIKAENKEQQEQVQVTRTIADDAIPTAHQLLEEGAQVLREGLTLARAYFKSDAYRDKAIAQAHRDKASHRKSKLVGFTPGIQAFQADLASTQTPVSTAASASVTSSVAVVVSGSAATPSSAPSASTVTSSSTETNKSAATLTADKGSDSAPNQSGSEKKRRARKS